MQLPDPQHRPHRPCEGCDVHRLLRPAELHRRPRRLHHRPVARAHRHDQGRRARLRPRPAEAEDPTIAALLKPLGYATGQFGKNHLGDKRRLPADHARLRRVLRQPLPPERRGRTGRPRLPAATPAFKKRFGPRGVLHCKSDGKGGQSIEDTGPLTRKRMETIDDEDDHRLHGLHRSSPTPTNKPFFVWYNTTRHARPHALRRQATRARAPGRASTTTSWSQHDENIGTMLAKLDELGIADDTIVMYSTDNGPHYNELARRRRSRPLIAARRTPTGKAAGACPRRALARPPSNPASVYQRRRLPGQDWLPTLLAAAGETDISAKLLHRPRRRRPHLQGPSSTAST
jgi:arylsulfatase A-like enzyme